MSSIEIPGSPPPPSGVDREELDVPIVSTITVLLAVFFFTYLAWNGRVMVALPLLIVICSLLLFLRLALRTSWSMICRCVLPILIGGFAVEAYEVLNQSAATQQLLAFFNFHERYNEAFHGALATLYAIITAMALVKGIEDFDGFRKNLAEEAYKVRLIDDMVRYFNSGSPAAREAIAGLRYQFVLYASNVASFRDMTNRSDNLNILRRSQQYIASLTPEDENDKISLWAIMEAHGDLGTLRAKRIAAAVDKIPRYLILALWLMAITLILPFMVWPEGDAGQAVDPGPSQATIIFLMASLNSFLLLMLSDISDPFDGFWQVHLGAFTELVELLTEELHSPEPPAAPPG